eukprot:TRINITY_DN4344_c0_g1_i1.p1 TRINITY_DN4344_c0_g1~~TRINITY_DN4344_c0_g1_i1.p1  ORF type:complete len:234 (-),score=37.98 TRINITY_DN4344_c0_g1_i1:655-1356(-)
MVFSKLLEHLYLSTVHVNPAIAADLFIAADYYVLGDLMKQCESVLCRNVTPQNALSLYTQLCQVYPAPALSSVTLRVLLHDFNSIKMSDEFILLPKEVRDVLEKQKFERQQAYLQSRQPNSTKSFHTPTATSPPTSTPASTSSQWTLGGFDSDSESEEEIAPKRLSFDQNLSMTPTVSRPSRSQERGAPVIAAILRSPHNGQGRVHVGLVGGYQSPLRLTPAKAKPHGLQQAA